MIETNSVLILCIYSVNITDPHTVTGVWHIPVKDTALGRYHLEVNSQKVRVLDPI